MLTIGMGFLFSVKGGLSINQDGKVPKSSILTIKSVAFTA